ncbi:MAG: hypothetical protein LBQ79_01630 [Deltaproteobacteria bacterium]|jgi:hypothetical protein|nr:hypothetical protein [Deltaproteobacteria bacterium]
MTGPEQFPGSGSSVGGPAVREAAIPEWDAALTAICRSQTSLADGGPAVAALGGMKWSEILTKFESVSCYRESLFKSPMLNAEQFGQFETCIRHLSRSMPLETVVAEYDGGRLEVPTDAEILRLKSALVLLRNGMRDYLDLAIFSSRLGSLESAEALKDLDRIYPLSNGESVLNQMLNQLSSLRPFDFSEESLQSCENLPPEWRIWDRTVAVLRKLAIDMFDASCQGFVPRPYDPDLNGS